MNRTLLLALLLLSVPLGVSAQIVNARGMGSTAYSMYLNADDKAKALENAKINAVERYFAESGDAESQNFDKIRPTVQAKLNDFVLGTTVLSEEDSSDTKKYTVVARVELNIPRLRNALKSASTVGSKGAYSSLTFLFVGRQAASVRNYDARTSSTTNTTSTSSQAAVSSSLKGKVDETVTPGSVEIASSFEGERSDTARSARTVEKEGSTTQNAADVSWRIVPTNYINTTVSGIFASAGFDVVDAAFIEPETDGLLSIKAMQGDYTSGNDLQPQTLRNVAAGLQKAGVPYMALTTMDIGIRDKDAATGLTRVHVTVTGKVLDLRGRFPRTVSSVGPVQYAGTGTTEDSATTSAMRQAAMAASRELVSQINTVGVR
jgi:hypothetical protein